MPSLPHGALLLAAASLLMAVDYPERMLTFPREMTSTNVLANWASVTATDAGFVSVWNDYRQSFFDHAYVARYDTTGRSLDLQPVRVNTGLVGSEPTVSCKAGSCVVLWHDAFRSLYSRSFSVANGALGSVSMLQTGQHQFALAASPTAPEFVVITTQGGLWSHRVGFDGAPLAARVSLGPGTPSPAAIAASSAGFGLIVPTSGGNGAPLQFMLLAPDGSALSPLTAVGALRTGQLGEYSVAPYAGGYLVVWTDLAFHLAFRRFGATGVAIDAMPQYLLGTEAALEVDCRAHASGDVMLTWISLGHEVAGARLDANSMTLTRPATRLRANNNEVLSRLRTDLVGETLMVTNDRFANAPTDIYITTERRLFSDLSPTGRVSPPVTLQPLRLPRVTATDGGFWVVGLAHTDTGGLSWLQSVDFTGAQVGPRVTLASHGPDLMGLDVDGQWAVTTLRSQVSASRLDAQGAVVDVRMLGTGYSDTTTARIAQSAGRWLVVYGARGGPAGSGLLGVVIEADGGASGRMALRSEVPGRVEVVASPTGWLVAFLSGNILRVGRLNHPAVWADGVGITVSNYSSGDFSIAASDAGYLAVYGRPDTFPDLYVRLLDPTLTLLGTERAISVEARMLAFQFNGPPDAPDVMFDGQSYVVVFSEVVPDGGAAVDLVSRRVFFDGGFGPRQLVAGGLGDQFDPAVVAGPQGRTFVAYESTDFDAGATQIWVRASATVGLLAPCLSTAECSVGLCMGICCQPGLNCPADMPDAGDTDGGSDGGPVDGGDADGGAYDGGDVDGGAYDGGEDAGSEDAGGAGEDAGHGDGGVRRPQPYRVGCDCSTSPLALLGALAVTLFTTRVFGRSRHPWSSRRRGHPAK